MGKNQKHYLEDGTLWDGPTHKMPDGSLHTESSHESDSKKLYHADKLPQNKRTMMRNPKMKRRGGMDLVIAVGGTPEKKPDSMHNDMGDMSYGKDKMDMDELSMYQERIDLLEERMSRLESMIAEEEQEDDDEMDDEMGQGNSDSYYG
jgi:hypothetical protein